MSGNHEHSMSREQMAFAVFCIENLADELKISGDTVYKMLTEDSDILESYIVGHYEPLHTQGRDYIVRDLIECLQQRGLVK